MTFIRERKAQKSRTREAILAGARALAAQGQPVSVTAAADLAGVSKATAYRYFSDPAVLVAEAGLAVEVKTYEEIVGDATGTRDRLCAVSLYFFDLALENEAGFRQFLARSLDAWIAEGCKTSGRRGARRVAMFRRALKDAPVTMPKAAAERLVRALSAATGAEIMITLLDVCGADRESARATVLDLTNAVLDRFLPAGAE